MMSCTVPSRPVDLFWERGCWSCGWSVTCGVDEVGRGALAGPLLAAAVVFDPGTLASLAGSRKLLSELRDSKTIAATQRQSLLPLILERCAGWAVGIASAPEIDDLGLTAANRLAMERAVSNLHLEPHVLLIDAVLIDLDFPQVALIDGDARSVSIGAASIVAKVSRDRLMEELEDEDCRFSFGQHRGYGTRRHLEQLESHGPGPYHRRSFSPVARLAGVP